MAVVSYKCTNCGGPLEFKVDSQNWKCDFCLSDFDSEAIKNMDNKDNDKQIKEEAKEKDIEFEEKAVSYSCNSCGAEIVTDDITAATFCYYCHSPTILPGRLSGNYRPSKVIPFKVKKETAIEEFVKWCKKKPLLSKDFTTQSQLDYISGVYVPFWLFNCRIKGSISADARRVRSWTTGNKRFTETKYYDLSREATGAFGLVPADGSVKIDDQLMETIEPFDYSQMEDFSMSYLSGYMAEKYDKEEKDAYKRVETRVHSFSSKLLQETVRKSGYSSVSVKACNVNINKENSTYVLLPAWIFTYKYKDKMYIYAMNGQTGKIAGNLPISKSRMAFWFGIISASIFVILLIGGLLL
ncbi:hypothetical protein EDC18_11048 [Natranaerovirga pectinivora]|uniref:Replication restart DNA helicase PriA n=1 Tax=Natranaerovirga pectinivora TaxID=682400 RepID=A0A4R3MHB1_9FIRM|nr:hypothetical protein [Natranaerovirga pectinivora]TCT12974.1 hypothetical protein EDC18_11048 [Natranaerovirga pectinivora]